MKLKSVNLLILCGMIGLCSCSSHLISDEAERQSIENDFELRKKQVANSEVFKIFSTDLGKKQREALNFLYAYMPLADMVDHDGEYFLENVKSSFKAKKEMKWGKDIPEREFLHFVLPIRVNNEDIDESRMVFFEELKDRVKGLSLYDAVLEVNHWCHEKVVYTPSDSRTSSPLASVKTAYGRCGEESTFTVAALRSVCIPARQVYTPRWAHTDDNHAWVEAWVDGKWYFMGACEPAPILNLGWFNAPASRGMLMHTKVFGKYNGPEEIMKQTATYTEINVIDNYAPSARMDVKVVDESGNNLSGATVDFKLYNYAEFYTVAQKQTDENGHTFLTAGQGDMLIWAYKEGNFGYAKASFGTDKDITIQLNRHVGKVPNSSESFDIIPPVEHPNIPDVTEEQSKENQRRTAEEDDIRNAYVATFMTDASARTFAREHGMDENAVSQILVASRGNHSVITEFMSHLKSENSKKAGIDLLQRISAKDLRDVKLDVLMDHMMSHLIIKNGNYYKRFVRNPRISNELLTPYQKFFDKNVPQADVNAFRADPSKIVDWVSKNIRVVDDCNLGGSPISPAGVWKVRMADAHSRDIFFVALTRSMGIPARIDEVTGKVQYILDENVVDVQFGEETMKPTQKGLVIGNYTPVAHLKNPKYYSHFTISKLKDNGSLQLLNYEEGNATSEGDSYDNLLRLGLRLEAGTYVLVSGTRLANGGVLSQMSFFTIEPNGKTNVELKMRELPDEIKVIGNFDSESLYQTIDTNEKKSILSTTGRGYFIVGVLGVGQEPTNHALKDIAALNKDFEQWGQKIVLLFPNKEAYQKFNVADFPGLPSNIVFGVDTNGIQNQILNSMKMEGRNGLPVFIIADTFNRIVFSSQGYTIGLGEQLMKVIKKL